MKTRSERVKRNGCAVTDKEMKRQNNIFLAIAIVFMAIGFSLLVHQTIVWGRFFEMDDFLHHENFFVLFFAFGVGIIIARYAFVKWKK